MIYSGTYLTGKALKFFSENKNALLDYLEANKILKKVSGINNFFNSNAESVDLFEKLAVHDSTISGIDRRGYGDFQTNNILASKVTEYAFSKYQKFEFVLEPTCGKGNFLLASIKYSKSIKKIVGLEIYEPYVWETKFKILSHYLENEQNFKPDIDIILSDAFEFQFEELAKSTKNFKTLIIGNPPWVTNSELGSMDSLNLPQKSNFKKHNGFDAITGKGNFDIGENISQTMLNCFQNHNGIFAFLIKNSVVKNLIQDQKRNRFRIGKCEKLNIDSKKEFNASVNACLFVTELNNEPNFTCKEFDFYSLNLITTFGWYKDKFVYSVEDYDKTSVIDGKSIFTWRSGIKHDCSKVMELQAINGHFKNGLGEEISLEKNLIYGLLKSSDLKDHHTNTFRKLTIITQNKIGQETSYIQEKFPLTYNYLKSHKSFFEERKSSIYKEKPDFSIFGVGDYSFTKYKVAISGLYKSTHFTLVKPDNSKPIMLDDTCYFIGFNKLEMAQIAHYLTNSNLVQKFLKSIIFSDSKRSINKDILMRIDFAKAFENCDFKIAKEYINELKIEHWKEFGETVKNGKNNQMTLF
jgi:hypothetical protein